jgi:hypothetical protein
MSGKHLYSSLISSSKQINAIAAYVGLSVEIKEGTSDIVKTPTLTNKDGFSVFGVAAIGCYSESCHSYALTGYSGPREDRCHIGNCG